MRYLKTFRIFKESINIEFDLLESLSIDENDLLSSMKKIDSVPKSNISTEERLGYDLFILLNSLLSELPSNIELEQLSEKTEFINLLTSLKLRKSKVEYTGDFQTFVNKPCKFMFIFGSEANDLETVPDPPINPIFLLFQSWYKNDNDNYSQNISKIELYEPQQDINKFYDKLSSKKINVLDGQIKYEYQTSNGNEWELKDSKKENDIFKKVLRKEELRKLVNERNLKIEII